MKKLGIARKEDIEAFGLAGLRIGWLATRSGAALQRMKELKDYTTICAAAPSEILALMALRARQSILDTLVARIAQNLETARAFFAGHAEIFDWVPPQAGTVCFPRLKAARATGGHSPASEARATGTVRSAGEFCARVLERTGVLLLPSTVYDYDDSHFRLGLGRKDFGEGLAALDDFLRAGSGL